jgi:hypothetical protein
VAQRLQHLASVVPMVLSSAPAQAVGLAVVPKALAEGREQLSEIGCESWLPFAQPKGAVKALTQRHLRLLPPPP